MTFPIAVFKNISAELVSDTRTQDPRLYRNKVKGSKTPYYMITMVSPPLAFELGMTVAAILDSYQGEYENFPLPNPIPQVKSHTGLALVGAHSKGDKQVTIGGFEALLDMATGGGDFIQIDGSVKAYRLLAPQDANASGEVTVELSQGLVQDYPDGASVNYGSDVTFQVCMIERGGGDITTDQNKYISHDVEVIEQL